MGWTRQGLRSHAVRNIYSQNPANGSKSAQIHSVTAPKDRFPRQLSPSLPVYRQTRNPGGVAMFWKRLLRPAAAEAPDEPEYI